LCLSEPRAHYEGSGEHRRKRREHSTEFDFHVFFLLFELNPAQEMWRATASIGMRQSLI
jgi:hypothetical protein